MVEQKVAQIYPKIVPNVAFVVLLKKWFFKNSPKGHHIFGLGLQGLFCQKHSKIADSGHTGESQL